LQEGIGWIGFFPRLGVDAPNVNWAPERPLSLLRRVVKVIKCSVADNQDVHVNRQGAGFTSIPCRP